MLAQRNGPVYHGDQSLRMEAQSIEAAPAVFVQQPHKNSRIDRGKDNVWVLPIRPHRHEVDCRKQNLRPEDRLEKYRDGRHLLLPILAEVADVSHHLIMQQRN